ncbi:MAG: hypothetical protein JNM84_07925 [Planctomycetes bacterium]|nr:hypothetical protein [Planctomycetota bacterium]
MRTWLFALALASLTSVLGFDFARRVARAGTFTAGTTSAGLASELQARLLGDHQVRFSLASFDGTSSRVELQVRAGEGTQLAEILLQEIELDGQKPTPTSPRLATTANASTLELPLVFRDVRWQPEKDPPSFEAYLRYRCRVRYAGDAESEGREESASYPLRVSSGPGYEALVAAYGEPR